MTNMVASGIYAFLILIVVSVLMSARVNYMRTRKNPMLIVLCISVLFWLFADLAVLHIHNIGLNVLLFNVLLAFVSYSSLSLFLVIHGFVSSERQISKSVVKGLFVVPTITLLVALTSPFHSLFRNVESFVVWPRSISYTVGAWMYVHTVFSFALAILSIVVTIQGLKKAKIARGPSISFILALVMLLAGNLMYMQEVLPINIDPTSIGVTIAVVLIHLSISDSRHSLIFRMFNTLKSRTTFPVLLMMFLLMLSTIYVVARSTRLMVESFEDDTMVAATRSIHAYLESYERQTFMTASAMGRSAELISRINSGNRDLIWQYLYERKMHFGVDEIIVADHNGITLARSHMSDSYGDDVSGVPSIAAGLRGEHLSLYTPTPTAYMVMTSAAPVMDGGRIVGSVVVNFVIGTSEFLDRISDIFGVDATVFAGDTSVASTLIHPVTGARAVGTAVAPHVAETVIGRSEHMMIELNIFGMLPYLAYYFPLRGADGSPTGMFFIGLSQEYTVATVGSQIQNIILIAFFGLIVVSSIMYWLISVSLKPLDVLRDNIRDVAAGRMNINMDRSKITTDEIGVLTQDVLGLADIIKDMVNDLSAVQDSYVVQGDSKYRIDAGKYQNSFRVMIENVNSIFDSEVENITDIVGALNKIGDGDFNVQIKERNGDWKVQSEAFLALIDNLKGVSTEVGQMIDAAAVKGNLNFQIDADKYKGDWCEIMIGLNSIADAVNRPVTEIKKVITELDYGRFNTLVEGDYHGDFLDIKMSVNSTIRGLSSVIQEIDECLGSVANGDLTRLMTMNLEESGDFKKIQQSVNHIVTTLSKTMTEISQASAQVLTGARQISNGAADLATGAQEQASSIEELNAGIDLINQQIKQNADNAFEARSLSNKSTTNAQEGNDAMKKMLEAMEQIRESSNNISQIIKVIEGIAFQTNLLALNASVEAARAGEHGKGFSVVADEVRNLAGRSQSAANETTGLIEVSIGRVEAGADIAESTSQSLDVIVKNAEDVLAIINGISKASSEQSEAISQISEGLVQISKVVQSNSAVSEETAAASEELNSQAEMLQGLVNYFKLKK